MVVVGSLCGRTFCLWSALPVGLLREAVSRASKQFELLGVLNGYLELSSPMRYQLAFSRFG